VKREDELLHIVMARDSNVDSAYKAALEDKTERLEAKNSELENKIRILIQPTTTPK
jgi:hypothetical protein